MKKIILILALLLVMAIPVSAGGELLVDDADILTNREEEKLLEKLEQAGFVTEYAEGYGEEELLPDETKIAEAVQTAQNCDYAVVFAGLPDSKESEGYDRADMKMPASHVALIEAVAAVNPNTVQRAVGELEAEGILVSRTTQGCYVTEDAAVLARAQQNAAKKLIADFARQAGELSLDRDTVIHMLQEEMTDECTGM